MRAAIYARISDDKEGAGLGVARQEQDCRELCDRRDWTVADVYADNDRSAYSGKPRPGYQRLLEDAKAGSIDAIVAWHTDRLHRSPRELETFIETVEGAGIRIETVRAGILDLATPAGRMIARQLGTVARYESEHKSERQSRKALEIATNGGVAGGGTRAFGFEADRTTIRENEADIIRELAKRLLAGETMRALCVDLNDRGITSPAGTRWQPSPLRRMLRSARISGQREHHGEIVADAQWPAIITKEQTARIRSIFADPSRQMTRAPRRYLLKGLLRCHACGAVLVSRPREDGERRYVCARGPQYVGCGKTYVLAEPLEEFVTEAVLWRLDTPALADVLKRQEGDTPDAWQQQTDEITGRLDELATAFAAGAISMREWLAARQPLQQRLETSQRQVRRNTSVSLLAPYTGSQGLLRKQWPALSLERRHAIISAVLSHVVVGPGRRGFNRFDPARFELVWRY
jgi:site-specific DNA recombinase